MDGGECRVEVRVQAEPFDASRETARLTLGRHDIGAVVAFTGLCRDEDGTLAALEIEHYSGMAEAEIRRVVDEAIDRWPVNSIAVVHRHGRIEPGQQIVLVVTASRHRSAAFEAANFLMDYLKTRAPFWKKAHGHDGCTEGWVTVKATDAEAASRWDTSRRRTSTAATGEQSPPPPQSGSNREKPRRRRQA